MVEQHQQHQQHQRQSGADLPGVNRFAARGPYRLAYEVVPVRNPDAAVVVLLHNLLAGRGEWAVQREALAGRFTLLLPEARGHGTSAGLTARRYAVADLVADTLAVLDHAGVDRAHLVGHGLGGVTAWELAATVPERVRSLALIEPELTAILDGDPDPLIAAARRDLRESDRTAADAAYKELTDRALDVYLAPRRGLDWRQRLPRSEQAAFRRHVAALAGILTALDGHVPTSAVGGPTVPTLVAHGSAARPVVRLVCRRLAGLRPESRLATVPTDSPADNALGAVAGAALNDLLVAFLTDRPPPTPAGL